MDDVKVDSREVMSDGEIKKYMSASVDPFWLDARTMIDLALSRYAAKMGTGGRRVEGYAYPYTQGHWGFTSKPDGDGYGDIEPATLCIHEPPKPKCPTCGSDDPGKRDCPPSSLFQRCQDSFHPKPVKSAEERIREALAFVDRRRWEEDSPCVRMARILRGEGGR